MAAKNLEQSSKSAAPKRPLLQKARGRKASRLESGPTVGVRPPEKIPASLLNFFKIDPRTQQPYKPEEKIFFSQVLMHEIDEGLRLLERLEKRAEAKAVGNFSNQLHITQRLELVRNLLASTECATLEPERVRGTLKARNNQLGAARANLGSHPAVAVTEVGIDYKPRNEDAFLMMPHQKTLALADGMGGHVAGHIASGVAVDFFEAGVRNGMDIERAIVFANEAIMTRTHNDPKLGGMHPMGCTFAAVQIRHTMLKVAHVGDTKVLVLRDGEILFESLDHTQGQELLREGLVDACTALELNHILNRCIGLDSMRPDRDVDASTLTLAPGDRVLLATDGVTDNFFDGNLNLKELAELASSGSLTQAAEVIVDQCQDRMRRGKLTDGRRAKCDNLSLAMFEFRG
ncbi:MAG: SpoIIE family protein phosphatase [Deltaproteobacteria bacterium]|nr:SpoIIE family protein phosphatase [Deltaproteobacteria bacterium]